MLYAPTPFWNVGELYTLCVSETEALSNSNMIDQGNSSKAQLVCSGCKTLLLTGANERECVLCFAYRAGRMELQEGMHFFVTEASVRKLQSYVAGDWIASRVLETHDTYERARQCVVFHNLRIQKRPNPETFVFVTSDGRLIRTSAEN
jgi:LSD1 subclass zinc finger protein